MYFLSKIEKLHLFEHVGSNREIEIKYFKNNIKELPTNCIK